MKLIPLDALVAEIERLKADALQKKSQCKRSGLERIMHQIGAYNKVLSFIDTLEVKDVEIEKELDSMITPELKFHKALPSLFDVAKHFFELGLKASNPLTWEDVKLIWTIGDEIPYMPEEEFFKELLNRFKAQKGE